MNEKTEFRKEFDTHFCLECGCIGGLVHCKELDSNEIKTYCEDCYVKHSRNHKVIDENDYPYLFTDKWYQHHTEIGNPQYEKIKNKKGEETPE